MRAMIRALTLAIVGPAVMSADISTTEARRIQEAATVLKEIHAVPDKDVPKDCGNAPHACSSCRR
jgi:aminoglycoside phosphotransferase (APT) family kinase protein